MIKIKLNDLPEKRGIVKRILVSQGSYIRAYDTILIIECEGKEVPVITLLDGYIEKIYVDVDQRVKRGDIVVKIKTQIDTSSFNAKQEDDNISSSCWKEINDPSLSLDDFNNDNQLLNADFTKKFKEESLEPKGTNESNSISLFTKLDLVSPSKSLEETNDNVNIVCDDTLKSSDDVIKEMQDRNATGVSKFRQRILSKVDNIQQKTISILEKQKDSLVNDNVSDVPPLSFREIIMKRVSEIQKDLNTNENLTSKVEKPSKVVDDIQQSQPILSYSEKLMKRRQELLNSKEKVTNARDKIVKKINLIRKGEINKNSDLEDIKNIFNNTDESWTSNSNEVPLKYRPSKHNKKESIVEDQIVRNSYAQKLAKLVNDVNASVTTSTDLISEFAPTSKINFFNVSKVKEDDVISSPVKINKLENEPSLVEQNLTSPINYDVNELEKSNVIPAEPKYIGQLKDLSLESREKIDNNKGKRELLTSLRFGKYYALPTTLNCEVDITEIVNLREKMLASSNASNSLRLSYKVYILKAISLSLEQYPQLNAVYDVENNELVIKHYHNIATVIQSSQGMQMPVIHSVNTLSVVKLDEAIEQSNQRIRANNPNIDEFSNSTIIVTDFGAFGAISGTSLLHHPHVAVISVGKILRKPVVWQQNIAIRHMMYFSVTFDQRVVDISLAGHFLEDLKNNLEKPYILSVS